MANYKVDIQILNTYKGNSVNAVFIKGYNGVAPKIVSSCDLEVSENAEYLVFGFKEGGKLYIDYCSTFKSDSQFISYADLDLLKTKLGDYHSNAPFSGRYRNHIPPNIFISYPSNFYGKSYIVKITIDQHKAVTEVKFIASLDKNIQERVANDIKQKIEWKERLKDVNTNYSYAFLTQVYALKIP